MSIKVVLTLVIAFVIVVFGLFNSEIVAINLIGFKQVCLPLSVLIFFVFIIGAAYAAVLSFQIQIEQALTIRKLKKKIQELKDAADLGLPEPVAFGTAIKTVAAIKDTKSEAPALGPLQKIRAMAPQKKPIDASKAEGKTEELPGAQGISDEDDDEGGLPGKLRDIALRRIQNG
jgi:uncharacterized membrane protein YciS (DUF1049 family)